MSELLSRGLGNGGKPKRARQYKPKKGSDSAQVASTEGASTEGASTGGASTGGESTGGAIMHVPLDLLVSTPFASTQGASTKGASTKGASIQPYNSKSIFIITDWNQLTGQPLKCIAEFIANVFTRERKILKSHLFDAVCEICKTEFKCKKIIFAIQDEWPGGDLFLHLVAIGLISNYAKNKYCYPPLLFSLFPDKENTFATDFFEKHTNFSRIPTYSISQITPVLPPQNWRVSLEEVENFTNTFGLNKECF